MKQVHFTLQGKGGVGKSFVSSLITQYLRAKGEPVVAVDTDPVNATLAGYKAFGTQRLELMEGGSLVERNFDALIERVVAEDSHFVIDNGAASFIPLSYYIAENDAINVIAGHGKHYRLRFFPHRDAARFTVGIDAEWSDEKPGGLANYTPSYEGGNDACQPGEVAISDLLARSPSWKSLRRPTPW